METRLNRRERERATLAGRPCRLAQICARAAINFNVVASGSLTVP
jgi:hypothetical protein